MLELDMLHASLLNNLNVKLDKIRLVILNINTVCFVFSKDMPILTLLKSIFLSDNLVNNNSN